MREGLEDGLRSEQYGADSRSGVAALLGQNRKYYITCITHIYLCVLFCVDFFASIYFLLGYVDKNTYGSYLSGDKTFSTVHCSESI